MDLADRVCLVTGATSGVGREAAVMLAARGATLFLTGRNRAAGEALAAELNAARPDAGVFVAADLSTLAEVRRLAAEVRARHAKLHVLLNNAGLVLPRRELTPDGFEKTFAVNHLAPFLLTQELLPLLKAGTPARIVNVSSEAHRALGVIDWDNLQGEKSYRGFRAYCLSKLANVLFTQELDRRLAGTGVTANAVHPGVVVTGIWRGVGGSLLGLLAMLAKPFMTSVAQGAAPLVKLAADPTLEGVSGRYFNREKEVKSSPLSHDREAAARLWDMSDRMVQPKGG